MNKKCYISQIERIQERNNWVEKKMIGQKLYLPKMAIPFFYKGFWKNHCL